MVDVFGQMQENCSRSKVHSMEAAECTSPSTCAQARSSFPLSQQTKPFRESRPLPTKLDVACKNAAHKCLAVWGRLVAAWLRIPLINRSIDPVLVFNYWADRACMVTTTDGERELHPNDPYRPRCRLRRSIKCTCPIAIAKTINVHSFSTNPQPTNEG